MLAQYVESGSETAFRELVARYVDLVCSAALRLVNGDTHRVEDVTQTVFADLARQARTLSREVMLGGWLHRHTCFVASNTMRGERRREARERQAVEMNNLEDHSAENLALIAPMLDEAVNQLGAAGCAVSINPIRPLTNIIEEKSNRIIEVLLSSVTLGELMMGKLFGIAAVHPSS